MFKLHRTRTTSRLDHSQTSSTARSRDQKYQTLSLTQVPAQVRGNINVTNLPKPILWQISSHTKDIHIAHDTITCPSQQHIRTGSERDDPRTISHDFHSDIPFTTMCMPLGINLYLSVPYSFHQHSPFR